MKFSFFGFFKFSGHSRFHSHAYSQIKKQNITSRKTKKDLDPKPHRVFFLGEVGPRQACAQVGVRVKVTAVEFHNWLRQCLEDDDQRQGQEKQQWRERVFDYEGVRTMQRIECTGSDPWSKALGAYVKSSVNKNDIENVLRDEGIFFEVLHLDFLMNFHFFQKQFSRDIFQKQGLMSSSKVTVLSSDNTEPLDSFDKCPAKIERLKSLKNLKQIFASGRSIYISGATGSGKTEFMCSLALALASDMKRDALYINNSLEELRSISKHGPSVGVAVIDEVGSEMQSRCKADVKRFDCIKNLFDNRKMNPGRLVSIKARQSDIKISTAV